MSKELEEIILYLNATEPKGLYCKNIEIIKSALERKEKLEKSFKLLMKKCDLKNYKKREGCTGCSKVIDFSYKEIDKLIVMLEELEK